jgi:hypothetical protein
MEREAYEVIHKEGVEIRILTRGVTNEQTVLKQPQIFLRLFCCIYENPAIVAGFL